MDPGRLAMDGLLLALAAGGAATDVRSGRVYNAMTYSGAAAGLVLNAVVRPPVGIGLGPAALGAAVGLVPLLFAALFGAIGAGDAKLMGAVGSFVGPTTAVFVLLYSCLAGAVLAVGVILWKEGFVGLLLRMKAVFQFRRGDDGFERLRFPFALAIFVGTAWAITERNLGGSVLDLVGLSGRGPR